MQFHQLTLAALYLLLAAAAASDVASRRVPNSVSVAVAVLGLAAHLGRGSGYCALVSAGAALLVLATLLVPFSRGIVGGGDVKLVVACTVWTGFQRLPMFVLVTALVGGLVALATAVWALRSPQGSSAGGASAATMSARVSFRARLRAARVPYSIAIAVGVVAALQRGMP